MEGKWAAMPVKVEGGQEIKESVKKNFKMPAIPSWEKFGP